MKWVSPSDAVRTLYEVEFGRVILSPLQDPMEVWAGNVTYETNTGWKIVVFNDCNSFDYIDSMTSPGGHTWRCEDLEFFFQYDPPENVVREVYGIKG